MMNFLCIGRWQHTKKAGLYVEHHSKVSPEETAGAEWREWR